MVRGAAERLVEGVVDMPVARRGVPVSVRVPPAKDRGIGALGIVNKTAVVKLALLRGVEALEAESK